MCKTVLTLLLVVASASVMADWVVVGKAENITVYADPATMHIKGDIVRMQDLADLNSALNTDDGKPYMSTKAQDEFDCDGGLYRTRSLFCYTGNMGKGDVVCTHSDPNHEAWHQVVPKSIIETMWQLACGKH
jgi:hypothetical protein